MTRTRIFAFICAVLLSSFAYLPLAAQDGRLQRDTTRVRGTLGRFVSYLSPKEQPLFCGVALGVDALGSGLAAFSSYGEYSAMVRINLKQKFFPVFEAGLGVCDRTDDATDIHLKVSAPYFRIGCDYNFLKDLKGGNRVFGGLRAAYTSFSYDIFSLTMSDPVWHDHIDFAYDDVKSNMLWAELVFGLEARIWRNFHLGWSLRYRRRLHQKVTVPGQAWYVPGFGKNDSSNFGGTVNLVFEL